MEFDYLIVENWLKNTIPGIVILGIIGSIFGTMLFPIFINSIKIIYQWVLKAFYKIFGQVGVKFLSGEFASLTNTHCQHSTIQTCQFTKNLVRCFKS